MVDSGRYATSATISAVELSYGEMTTDDAGRIISKQVKQNMREQHGFCLTCPHVPVKLYEIKRFRMNPLRSTKVPRTSPGECEGGKCLKCQPGRRVSPTYSGSERSHDSSTSSSMSSPRDVTRDKLESRNRLNPLRWFGTDSKKKQHQRQEQAPRHRSSVQGTRQRRASINGPTSPPKQAVEESPHCPRQRRSSIGGPTSDGVSPESSPSHQRALETLDYGYGEDSPNRSLYRSYSPSHDEAQVQVGRPEDALGRRRRRRNSINGPTTVNTNTLTEEVMIRQQRLGNMKIQPRGNPESRHSINPSSPGRAPSDLRLEQYEKIVNEPASRDHTLTQNRVSRASEHMPRQRQRRHSLGGAYHSVVENQSYSPHRGELSSTSTRDSRGTGNSGSSVVDYGYGTVPRTRTDNQKRMHDRRHSINGAAAATGPSPGSVYEARKKMRNRRPSVNGMASQSRFNDSTLSESTARRRRYSIGGAATGLHDPNYLTRNPVRQNTHVISHLSLRVLSEHGNKMQINDRTGESTVATRHDSFPLETIGESEIRQMGNTMSSLESSVGQSRNDLVHDRWETQGSKSSVSSQEHRVVSSLGKTSKLQELEVMIMGLKAAACPSVFAEALVVTMERYSDDKGSMCLCLQTVASEFNDEIFDSHSFVSMAGDEKVIEAMAKFPDTKEIQELGCKVLRVLAVKESSRPQLIKNGSCQQIQKAVFRFINNASLVVDATAALRIFSTETEARSIFDQLDISTTVVEAMNANMEVPSIQRDGTAVVSNTAVNVLEKKVSTVDPSVFRVIVRALKSHSSNEGVAEDACFALKNLAYDSTNLKFMGQMVGEIDEILQKIVDVHSIRSASDVLEKIQLTRAADESLEERTLTEIESRVRKDDPDIILDLVQTIDNFRWSRGLVEACLRLMRSLSISSQLHRDKLSANISLRELRAIVDAFTFNTEMKEELSMLKDFF